MTRFVKAAAAAAGGAALLLACALVLRAGYDGPMPYEGPVPHEHCAPTPVGGASSEWLSVCSDFCIASTGTLPTAVIPTPGDITPTATTTVTATPEPTWQPPTNIHTQSICCRSYGAGHCEVDSVAFVQESSPGVFQTLHSCEDCGGFCTGAVPEGGCKFVDPDGLGGVVASDGPVLDLGDPSADLWFWYFPEPAQEGNPPPNRDAGLVLSDCIESGEQITWTEPISSIIPWPTPPPDPPVCEFTGSWSGSNGNETIAGFSADGQWGTVWGEWDYEKETGKIKGASLDVQCSNLITDQLPYTLTVCGDRTEGLDWDGETEQGEQWEWKYHLFRDEFTSGDFTCRDYTLEGNTGDADPLFGELHCNASDGYEYCEWNVWLGVEEQPPLDPPTPTPTPTTTPTGTPTITPTATITPTWECTGTCCIPDMCCEDFATPGPPAVTITLPHTQAGSCYTIIPSINRTIPQITDTLSIPGVEVCTTWLIVENPYILQREIPFVQAMGLMAAMLLARFIWLQFGG